MAIESDVLVVGGGLAGSFAALAAAREGAHVRLVSYKKSTLRQASGLVDVLGYLPADGEDADREGPLSDPLARLDDLPEDHPYRVVGSDAVRDGLEVFDDVAGDAYRGSHTDRNALLPTHGGTVKPTARYPASAAAGLASDDRETLLVGFDGLTDFDAPTAAAHLRAAGVPFAVEGVTLRFPVDLQNDAKVTRYARALDEDEENCRATLADRVADAVEDAGCEPERVGFPALVGYEHAAEVRAELADEVGVDVFEVPMGPPSLPGLRLEERMFDALDEAGVSIETGNPVVDHDADGDRVVSVTVDRTGAEVPYTADEFVLATGGLVGKGIESDRAGVREPIFDCHVPHPDDRYDWSEPEAFGDHEFARFGVVPDADLRPTASDGQPQYRNLRAAGAVLGGADPATECSAAGISLATGVAAGRAAAQRAHETHTPNTQ